MGKFTTQRVAEDGAIWATRQEPSASQNSIYAVRGESSLADSLNYKHRFEVDSNGEKISNMEAEHSYSFSGKTYFFTSEQSYDAFRDDPWKYADVEPLNPLGE